MNNKENLGTKIIKRFYGITGPLDEYRYQEITRIGNNAFIFLWVYLMISNLIALYVGLFYPEETLYVSIGLNIFVAVFGIGIYIILESKKVQINEEDINQKLLKKKMKKSTIIATTLYGGFMLVFNSLMAMRFDGVKEILDYMFSQHNIMITSLQIVVFGCLIYFSQLYRLKKIEKNMSSRNK